MECVILEDLDVRNLNQQEFTVVRQAIPVHGVICLRNQFLSVREQISFTRKLGESVLLPEGLRFNNTQDEYPELARVSNIRPDGTLIKAHKAAEYWHSDGDFWQPGRNYLFNLLHALIVPDEGGDTGFADLRLAYTSLDDSMKQRIKDLNVIVSCDDIPDFKDTHPDDREPDAVHSITHHHIETGQVGLYFGHTFATVHNLPTDESEEIVRALVNAIERPENQYVHQWQVGDLLIWDNTSVMHRSMGGYGNYPRLLHRTQAFIRSENQAVSKTGTARSLSDKKREELVFS